MWGLLLLLPCRTPQGLRALMRSFVTIVVPIYVGPYWAAFSKTTGSFAFVAFLSAIVCSDPSFVLEMDESVFGQLHYFCRVCVYERQKQSNWVSAGFHLLLTRFLGAAESCADRTDGGGADIGGEHRNLPTTHSALGCGCIMWVRLQGLRCWGPARVFCTELCGKWY